jgi:dolichol-phosphate mannosyltransferase
MNTEAAPYRYSIVIPTFNECDNMAPLLERIEHCGIAGYEIIVVDENSPDGTLAAVRRYAAGKPHIRGIANPGPRGLSPSIVNGFAVASGEVLCCMDGDLQHDSADLKGLLEKMADCDFVIGSRYAEGGGFAQRWNIFRVLISRTATLLARIFLDVRVSDPMSGFFAVRRGAFEDIRDRLDPQGFKIMLEMLFYLHRQRDCRVAEYGITFGKRLHGRSKLSYQVVAQYLQMLYRLRRRNRQP